MPNWNPRDLLVITTYIRQTQIHRVLIDNGSSIDILYEHWFRERPTTFKQGLKQSTRGPLVGFTCHQLRPMGPINLPLTLLSHDEKEIVTRVIEFSVVSLPADTDMLLGWPTLFQFQAIPSTIHGTTKFSTNTWSTTIVALNPKNAAKLSPH